VAGNGNGNRRRDDRLRRSPTVHRNPRARDHRRTRACLTKVETKAVLEAFGAAGHQADDIDGRIYFDLGTVNGARVRLTQSEMGAGGLGGAQHAVGKGIAALSPVAVIMVGIAFGVNDEKQHIGDVLVTEQLRPYELQRVGVEDGQMKIILRADKPHASPWLLNLFRSSEVTWDGVPLWFGPILTGEKLVDSLDFRNQLRTFEPEAVGGEMEGAGLYVACHDQKVDWILAKAICDWADGNKGKDKAERQALAAKNAATFVLHAFRFVNVDWNARRGSARLIAAPALAPAAPVPSPSALAQVFFRSDKPLPVVSTSNATGANSLGNSDVSCSSVDVRAAYRTIHAHHRRLLNLLKQVSEAVAERVAPLEQSFWGPYLWDRVPKETGEFLDRWVYDFIPIEHAYFGWSPSYSPEVDSFYVEITHSGDDAVDNHPRATEPHPSDLPPVEHSKTTVAASFYALVRKQQRVKASFEYWANLQNAVEESSSYDKAHLQDGAVHTLTVAGVTVRYGGFELAAEELNDRAAIEEALVVPLVVLLRKARS
jgi:nucleoside phosphorylase